MEHLRNAALAELQEEHPKYFESLGKHPRLLVGTEVPSLTHPGQNERLRDANDAREWQEAVKNILTEQIQTKAEEKQAELTEVFATVHASIDLFRNNHDLIPGTKQFDPELAREFTTMAKDYELRADGKLIGYSVPVQPLINQLRTRITEQRTKAAAAPAPPAAPAAPSPAQQRVAEQPRNDAGQWAPQAGIPSRAGQSGDGSSDAQEVIDAFIRQNGFHF